MRAHDDATRCVVFFGLPSPAGGNVQFAGTGFLAGYCEDDAPGTVFHYLMTCRHVANALEKHEATGFQIRINLKAGGSELRAFDKMAWLYPEDSSVDLAVCNFTVDTDVADHKFIPLLKKDWVDHEQPNEVGPGDPVHLVGLFRLHAGSQRSLPIVHSGHVALMPDPHERIPVADRTTGDTILAEGYLIEAQTLAGLSGSPIFAPRLVGLKGTHISRTEGAIVFGASRFLGVYSGAWEGRPGEILAADRNIASSALRVPVGMGFAVPANRVVELVRNNETLRSARHNYLRQLKEGPPK